MPEPEKTENPLAPFSTGQILSELRQRLNSAQVVPAETLTGIKGLSALASEIEKRQVQQPVQTGTEAVLPTETAEPQTLKQWLEFIKGKVQVVQRNVVGSGGDYRGGSAQLYPNPSLYFPADGNTISRQYFHTSDLHKYFDARWYEMKRKYPALLIRSVKSLTEPQVKWTEMVYQCEAPGDDRQGTNSFGLYIDEAAGKQITEALTSGRLAPDVFITLYDNYFPTGDKPRPEISNIVPSDKLSIVTTDIREETDSSGKLKEIWWENRKFFTVPFQTQTSSN